MGYVGNSVNSSCCQTRCRCHFLFQLEGVSAYIQLLQCKTLNFLLNCGTSSPKLHSWLHCEIYSVIQYCSEIGSLHTLSGTLLPKIIKNGWYTSKRKRMRAVSFFETQCRSVMLRNYIRRDATYNFFKFISCQFLNLIIKFFQEFFDTVVNCFQPRKHKDHCDSCHKKCVIFVTN